MTNREKLLTLIDTFSEQQVDTLLNIAENLQETDHPYDEASDPAVGLFSGPTDASERVKELLREGSRRYSGWTTKKD